MGARSAHGGEEEGRMTSMALESPRRAWADEASHSAMLEGLLVSLESSEEYVAGELTAAELVACTRRRQGLT